MTKQKRNVMDEMASRLRGAMDDLMNDLDRLMNPQPRTKQPVRVPVPVPVHDRRPRPSDSYR